MIRLPDAVERAEALAETLEEESPEREALADLLAAYRKLQGHYNYVCAEGHPDPWPPPPPLDEADPVEALPGRWREEADTLRGHGAEFLAASLERCAGELETAVRADGERPALRLVPAGEEGEEEDRMLKVDEAAEILGVKKRWLYDRSGSLPFARKLAPQTLRFSERGLREWLANRP